MIELTKENDHYIVVRKYDWKVLTSHNTKDSARFSKTMIELYGTRAKIVTFIQYRIHEFINSLGRVER